MVADLYAATFREEMGAATRLNYASLQWGDAGMTQFCKVIASGALAQLNELNLCRNQISDDGMKALASACAKGALPNCEHIVLNGNPSSQEARQAVRNALKQR